MPRASGPQVTSRDVEIVRWIGRHGIVTVEQVSTKFFAREDGSLGNWAAYRRLRKLEELRLIRRDPTFWREPAVLRATAAGARLAEIDVAPAHIVLAEVHHTLALVDLMEHLLDQNRGATMVTEREIRALRFRELGAGQRRPGSGRIPDGILHLKSKKTVAVELDLTSKRQRDIERVITGYKQERYDAVWWFARPAITGRIREIVVANRVDDLIDVKTWSRQAATG